MSAERHSKTRPGRPRRFAEGGSPSRRRSAGWPRTRWTLARWLAAYLVVFQALVSGLALGAMAAPGPADAFTLCLGSPDGDAGVGHSGDGAAHLFHDCTACPLAGGTPVLPQVSVAAEPQTFGAALPPAGPAAWRAPPVPLFESARPRAPPAAA